MDERGWKRVMEKILRPTFLYISKWFIDINGKSEGIMDYISTNHGGYEDPKQKHDKFINLQPLVIAIRWENPIPGSQQKTRLNFRANVYFETFCKAILKIHCLEQM